MAGQGALVRWGGEEVRQATVWRSDAGWLEASKARIVSLRAASGEEERERLRVLDELAILGSPPDPAFDALSNALRMILDVPLAFVVVLDAEHTHVSAVSGGYHGPRLVPREYTFCDLVVRGRAPVVIEDTASEPRYAGNPYLMGSQGYRFYVGVPLTTSSGAVVGALCGFAHEPRPGPGPDKIDTLCGLANSVVSTIELRSSERTLRRKEEALRKQSDLLQATLDSVQQGITAFDQDLQLVAWNQRAADLMGQEADVFTQGASYEDFPQLRGAVNTFGAVAVRDLAHRMPAGVRIELFRHEQVTANGRAIELSAVPLGGGGLLATCTDVTEERRRAAELKDQARRFAIQERVASIANEAGGLHEALALLLANVCRETKMLIGRVRQVTTRGIVDLGIEHVCVAEASNRGLPPAGFTDAARAVEQSQRVYRGEVPAAWCQAGQLPLLVYAFPVLILSDLYVFECYGETQLIQKDWHSIVRGYMETQLTRVAQRERIERLKGEFVSTVSHELQTPLTPVLGMLELLDAGMFGPMSDDARNAVAIAYQNSRRLARIVEDVLELETLKTGRTALDLKPQAVAPLVAEAVAAIAPITEGRAIAVSADAGCDALEAIVDAAGLTQILSKLLSNALKFSSAAISVRTARHQERVRISVIDQGSGIAPEFRTRIFEQFSQADGSDRRKVDGAGLGLAIVKALTDLLGASICFETGEAEGTTFHLDLVAASPTGAASPASP